MDAVLWIKYRPHSQVIAPGCFQILQVGLECLCGHQLEDVGFFTGSCKLPCKLSWTSRREAFPDS